MIQMLVTTSQQLGDQGKNMGDSLEAGEPLVIPPLPRFTK